MRRRKDYRGFKEILKRYGISRFYHFTDLSNVRSIVEHGGLISWGECKNKGIQIPCPSSSSLSRNIDLTYGLQYYVRISICKHHPMMYYALSEGRIYNPVILEIDTDVLFIEGNMFSDKNAARDDANIGGNIEDFEKIHFSAALNQSQFDLEEKDRDFYQAEILVARQIPLHYILNIDSFLCNEDN